MRLAALASLAATLPVGVPALAHADEVTRQDAAGRTIHFDVEAAGVDVDWYAALLRRALHGDEIAGSPALPPRALRGDESARVTSRLVPAGEVGSVCGSPHAGGCYGERRGGGGIMTVPAGVNENVAHTVLHEYGHHVDRSHP